MRKKNTHTFIHTLWFGISKHVCTRWERGLWICDLCIAKHIHMENFVFICMYERVYFKGNFLLFNFKAITWNSKWWVNVRNVQFNWKASIGDKIKRHQFNRKEIAWPVIGKLIDIFSLSLFFCLHFAFQRVQMLQISVNIIIFFLVGFVFFALFPTFFHHHYFVCHLVRHDL